MVEKVLFNNFFVILKF